MSENQFYSASEIAHAAGCSAKTIHRRAASEQWPSELRGAREVYAPPARLLSNLIPSPSSLATPPLVTFSDIATRPDQVTKVLQREMAVKLMRSLLHLGKEIALVQTVREFRASNSTFRISVASLRRWDTRFTKFGQNGLVEQKQGVVGRDAVADHLTEPLKNLGKAWNIEHGSVSRAGRKLMNHPDLPAAVREHLHDGHCTKSYITPSIRRALEVAPLTKSLAQGPRAARLAGPWTPGNYDDCKYGDVFVSDDMTDNAISWCEWPNALGYRIGQAQILPVMDVGSIRWLNVRAIMREGGQYNAQDDIWGLFGDTFDKFGLPGAFLLEGGHWQANAVIGVRTGLDNDTRFGGLASMGVKVIRSYDPRSKGMLEGHFHHLQCEGDAAPGYTGRDARKDIPELTKKRIALCKSGSAHPRQFFAHLSARTDHYMTIMENQNRERQEGKILKGLSPLEKQALDGTQTRLIADKDRWMYRSCMSRSKVTNNGAKATIGSGAKQLVYYYKNAECLTPRQGRHVYIYWNDRNPEADAIILDGTTRHFVCAAQYVPDLSRFNATDAQLDADAARKRAVMHYARTELRAIQPDLQRTRVLDVAASRKSAVPGLPASSTADIGSEIQAANERADQAHKNKVASRKIDVVAETLRRPEVDLTAVDQNDW